MELLPENKNDPKLSAKLESLMNERKRLMDEGMDDRTIARMVAEARNLKAYQSIEVLFRRIVVIGKCAENPHGRGDRVA